MTTQLVTTDDPDKTSVVDPTDPEPTLVSRGAFDVRSLVTSMPLALRKLSPRDQARNPVMFVVFLGAVVTTLLAMLRPSWFSWTVAAWLWFTVLFANLAEAVAEDGPDVVGGRGSVVHLCLQCFVDRVDEGGHLGHPRHDLRALPSQLLDPGRPVAVEHRGDVLEQHRALEAHHRLAHIGRLAPGPDYKLYLAPRFVDTKEAFLLIKDKSLRVGDVKTFNGFIVEVPAGVDVRNYNAVVIWCEAFHQFISTAEYQPPRQARK